MYMGFDLAGIEGFHLEFDFLVNLDDSGIGLCSLMKLGFDSKNVVLWYYLFHEM